MARERKGTITKRDGKLYARVQFKDETGKRRDLRRRAESRTHARQLIRELLKEVENSTAVALDAARITFEDLDSQSVKTTQISGVRGFDAAKNIKGRKRHLLVDTLGLLLSIVVTAACVQERDGARLVFARLNGSCKKLRRLWVDGGYRGPSLATWVTARFRFVLQVVLRREEEPGFVVLPRRWVVERTFAWLNLHRRLSKDYEVLTDNSEAMIYIAMTRLMLRRLKPL